MQQSRAQHTTMACDIQRRHATYNNDMQPSYAACICQQDVTPPMSGAQLCPDSLYVASRSGKPHSPCATDMGRRAKPPGPLGRCSGYSHTREFAHANSHVCEYLVSMLRADRRSVLAPSSRKPERPLRRERCACIKRARISDGPLSQAALLLRNGAYSRKGVCVSATTARASTTTGVRTCRAR